MRLDYRCYPCILDDLAGALKLVGADETTCEKVMSEAVDLLNRLGPAKKPPSWYITEVHRMVKRATGLNEPFADLRKRTNEIGVELTKLIRENVASLPDRERFAKIVMWCVAANHLDFRTVGTGYGFDPAAILKWLEEEFEKGLAVDDTEKFRRAASEAKRILYVHDNVGEVAVDTLLIEELKKLGATVTSTLRGGPITSDATMEDGRAAGVFDAADKVILAGPDTLGISLDEMTDDLGDALEKSDLIVSKGQANYYVLTEYIKSRRAKVAFLFSTKCDPVAETLGLKGKRNIVFVSE